MWQWLGMVYAFGMCFCDILLKSWQIKILFVLLFILLHFVNDVVLLLLILLYFANDVVIFFFFLKVMQ